MSRSRIVRPSAVEACRHVGDPDAPVFEALRPSLRDNNERVRVRAAEAIAT